MKVNDIVKLRDDIITAEAVAVNPIINQEDEKTSYTIRQVVGGILIVVSLLMFLNVIKYKSIVIPALLALVGLFLWRR